MSLKLIATKIRKLPLIRKYLILRQFIKFATSGILSTVLDFSVYIVLTRFVFLHYLWANFVALLCGTTINFTLNKTWTFRNHERQVYAQYIKFWTVAISGLVGAQYLLYLFVEKFSLYDIAAKLAAAIIVMFCRFFAQKYWVFKQSTKYEVRSTK